MRHEFKVLNERGPIEDAGEVERRYVREYAR